MARTGQDSRRQRRTVYLLLEPADLVVDISPVLGGDVSAEGAVKLLRVGRHERVQDTRSTVSEQQPDQRL